MKQIDQDPGAYRVQREGGIWTQRINRPLMRWMGIAGLAVTLVGALMFLREGGVMAAPLFFTVGGFLSGAAMALSLNPRHL